MTTAVPRLAGVGPWAKEKLEALERYLDFYTKVMKRQRWRTIYIDAFAGGGRAVVRESRPPEEASIGSLLLLEEPEEPQQQEFIRGSPRVALELPNPFSTYVFIDANPERIAAKLIRNTRRSPLYYLIWAGPHSKGLEGANHILRMGERLPPSPRRQGR